MDLRLLDLFAGGGGFSIAAHSLGWQTVAFVEKDTDAQDALRWWFPGVPIYDDILKFNGRDLRGLVDVVSFGAPCQPVSSAGAQKGKADERYLIPEGIRVAKECGARWLVLENVRGLVSHSDGELLEEICTQVEDAGFAFRTPYIMPASGIDADHERYRVFIVAHRRSVGRSGRNEDAGRQQPGGRRAAFGEFASPDSEYRYDPNDLGAQTHAPIPRPGGIGQQRRDTLDTGTQTLRPGDGRNASDELGGPVAINSNGDRQGKFQPQGLIENIGRRSGDISFHDPDHAQLYKGEREWRLQQFPFGGYDREHWLEAAARLCVPDDGGLPRELQRHWRTIYRAVKHLGQRETEAALGVDLGRFCENVVYRKAGIRIAGNAVVPELVKQIFMSIEAADLAERVSSPRVSKGASVGECSRCALPSKELHTAPSRQRQNVSPPFDGLLCSLCYSHVTDPAPPEETPLACAAELSGAGSNAARNGGWIPGATTKQVKCAACGSMLKKEAQVMYSGSAAEGKYIFVCEVCYPGISKDELARLTAEDSLLTNESHGGYLGGKNGSGVYQKLINLMPPHGLYIEAFLGSGAMILLNKKPAKRSIGIEIDANAVRERWGSFPPNTVIWNKDALEFLEKLVKHGFHGKAFDADLNLNILPKKTDPADVLIFIDWPYLSDSRSNGHKSYRHDMKTPLEHEEALRLVKSLPCMVMITHPDHPLYRKHLTEAEGWHSVEFTNHTVGGPVKDTVWMNYPEPTELHDYQYWGDRDSRWNDTKIVRKLIAKYTGKDPRHRRKIFSAVNEHFDNIDRDGECECRYCKK